MRKLLIYVIIFLTVRYSFCLKVYHSTLPIESTEGIAGLHYIKPNNANASLANSLTFCLRINYKRMLYGDMDTMIWHIGPLESVLMKITANYPNHQKWWIFDGKGWPMNNFLNANQWQHLCIAYDKGNNTFTIIKVLLNNNIYLQNFSLYT